MSSVDPLSRSVNLCSKFRLGLNLKHFLLPKTIENDAQFFSTQLDVHFFLLNNNKRKVLFFTPVFLPVTIINFLQSCIQILTILNMRTNHSKVTQKPNKAKVFFKNNLQNIHRYKKPYSDISQATINITKKIG